jgi:hypothetical protein
MITPRNIGQVVSSPEEIWIWNIKSTGEAPFSKTVGTELQGPG